MAGELFLVGTFAGILGTLVGLGGGFVVIPVLRLIFNVSPAHTAGASLVMVLANAVSSSIAYLRQGRADVRLAVLLAATGIPSSIAGAILVQHVTVAGFDVVYGILLILFFVDIMRRRNRSAEPPRIRIAGLRDRVLVDSRGDEFRYAWSPALVLVCGVILGFVSSFFGIGGGIVFVIFFIALFGMPPHVVTATSMLVMLLTSPVGVVTHALEGNIEAALALPLAAGGLLGGQLGPRIARRLSSPQLMTVLAFAVLGTAVALVLRHVIAH